MLVGLLRFLERERLDKGLYIEVLSKLQTLLRVFGRARGPPADGDAVGDE